MRLIKYLQISNPRGFGKRVARHSFYLVIVQISGNKSIIRSVISYSKLLKRLLYRDWLRDRAILSVIFKVAGNSFHHVTRLRLKLQLLYQKLLDMLVSFFAGQ